MLSKPAIPDETICSCLDTGFGLNISSLTFLPIGADSNTAVYRAVSPGGGRYFVKLRSGDFLEASVRVPQMLHELGIRQVIPPIPARDGRLWVELPPYNVILSPFIDGKNGFDTPLTDAQRIEFGRILKALHTSKLPGTATRGVPRETYTSRWQESVHGFLQLVETDRFTEPAAAATAALLRSKSPVLHELLEHTARLTHHARALSAPFILCHADIHAGNLHLSEDGAVRIIDWDTLKFAPVERDLMFVGAGLGGEGHTPEDEHRLFFEGYGPVNIDQALIAFYRCDRILEDIAVYCEELLLSTAGGEDRAQNFRYLESNFNPGGTIDLAYGRI